jgi:alpha-ribazole phosphatase
MSLSCIQAQNDGFEENQATTLYILRHGATERRGKKSFIGQIDPSLNPEGRKLAKEWQRALRCVCFSQIWSSDLKRAYETAEVVADSREITVRQSAELREICMGTWDGAMMSHIREKFPTLWQARGKDFANFRPPGAETFTELQRRVVPFIHYIMSYSSGNILIVTHDGVIRVLLCQLFQVPLSNLFRIHLDYGGLTLIKDINGDLKVEKVNLNPDTFRCIYYCAKNYPVCGNGEAKYLLQ